MADETGNLLDRDTAVRQQRDEAVPQLTVNAENLDAALRKLKRPTRLEGLGLTLGQYRMPDLDERRNTVQADVRPGRRAKFLRPGTSEQRDDDVRLHGGVLSSSQERAGLAEGQRLRRAALLPLRDVAQEHNVPLHLLPRLSASDCPPKNRMQLVQRVRTKTFDLSSSHRSTSSTCRTGKSHPARPHNQDGCWPRESRSRNDPGMIPGDSGCRDSLDVRHIGSA